MKADRIEQLIDSLKKRNFEVSYYETVEEARTGLLDKIAPGAAVGIGGSMTIKQLDIVNELTQRGCAVYWHWLDPAEKRRETCLQAAAANYYLCSANAVTVSGQIVNIDGGGNRVASMIFGPEKVLIVIGKNKIVGTLDEAMNRIKTIAAPMNAGRLGLQTPCAQTGQCGDCKLMCAVTTIIETRPFTAAIEVVIVNRDLGF